MCSTDVHLKSVCSVCYRVYTTTAHTLLLCVCGEPKILPLVFCCNCTAGQNIWDLVGIKIMPLSISIEAIVIALNKIPVINRLFAYRSEDVASVIIAAVVVILSLLVFWIFFYRRENAETAKCRKVLQKVFNANNGVMWENKYRSNWQTTSPISQWAGIEVQDLGTGDVVTDIQMRDNANFIGSIFEFLDATRILCYFREFSAVVFIE
jgi:hypothetical protein